VPSNRISKELADKIRDEYFPKKNARVKQTSQFAQSAAGVSASPNEPASREESAKDSGVEKRLNTCRICGVVCRSKSGLDNHFLNYHREEAFSDAVSRLKLENVSLESFSELQRKSFGEPRWFIDACLRGWGYILSREDQQLVATDAETLFEYARILESKIQAGSSGKRFNVRRNVVARIVEDIKIYESKLRVRKLKWRLLPPGKAAFPHIVKRFEHLSTQRPGAVFDINRLYRIHSLGPTETYVGIKEFESYVVFYFGRAESGVLDCPVTDNAIYVFRENWKSLSRLTKSDLLNSRRRDFERIIHKGDWFSRLKSLLSTRELRADLRRRQNVNLA